MKSTLILPLTVVSGLLITACGQDATDTGEVDATVEAPGEAATVVPEPAELLAPHQALARDLLKELIEIDTTDSRGDNTRAAEAMAARLLEAGFDDADVQVLAPAPRKGNLVARLRGRESGRKPILLLAHIDVVEADPADWTKEPFTFVEEDGYFYGRGVLDDKNEAAIHVANLIRLKQEGYQPDRDIIVALTADEEGGDHNGVTWLLENHRDLIDAEFAINEGGGGGIIDGEYAVHSVQASEKVYQDFSLIVTNPGGHSSLPQKENAIYRLADALTRIRNYDFPVQLNEITRAYFERSAELDDGLLGEAMRGLLQAPPDPASVEMLSGMPFVNSRMRTTCVATMVDAGHAVNALPQRAQANVNCRILPDVSIDSVLATLDAVVGDHRVLISTVNKATPSPPSPLTPEMLEPVERITQQMWPGVPVIPTMGTGATDGLYLRNAGIPVYGVSGIFVDVNDVRAHGQDERMLVKSFFEGQEFLYELTKALTQSDL
ncbi:MAG: M20/M25/M40 family metallo-hydrolase [Gammaproteobacteria bacterium]|nr:M20/M25/M40 family metallo-hydrolase [Gammaproteobacteria bacterium]